MNAIIRAGGLFLIFLAFAARTSAAPVPVPAAKFEPPTITLQSASATKIMLSAMLYAKETLSDEAFKKLTESIGQNLGDRVTKGLDFTRPAGGYIYLRGKPDESVGVLVIPVSDTKEFLGLLDSLGIGSVQKEDKVRGLYTLQALELKPWHTFSFLNGVSPVVRFHNKYAYIAFHNGSSNVLNDEEKLIPITALVDEKEPGLIAGTLHIPRFPKELQNGSLALLGEAMLGIGKMEMRAPGDMPKGFPAFARECVSWCQRNLDPAYTEGEKLTFRLLFDEKAIDYDLEAALTPKAKSGLATDIEAVKKPNGRFAQLLTKDAVAGTSLTLPKPLAGTIRATGGQFLNDWFVMSKKYAPEAFGGLFDTLGETINKQVGTGDVDIGGAIYGPNKDGLYTAVAGVTIADEAALEKAVKAALKDAPKEIADRIQWDAEKVGEIRIHAITFGEELPEELRKVFGEKPKGYITFTNKSLIVAFGSDAKAELAKAAALKSADVIGFNLAINQQKFPKFSEQFGGRDRLSESLAAKNRHLSFFRMDAFGGPELKIRMQLPMMLFAREFR